MVLAIGIHRSLLPSQACDAAGVLPSGRVVLSTAIIGSTTPSDAVLARCDFPFGRLYAPAAPGDRSARASDGLPSSRACSLAIPLPLPRGVPRRLRFQVFGAFHGLRRDFSGSALSCPLSGLASRGCRIRLMLRAGQLLPPKGLSTPGFDTRRFPLTPPACYRASWQLPGPDLHRQAGTSLSTWVISSASPAFIGNRGPRLLGTRRFRWHKGQLRGLPERVRDGWSQIPLRGRPGCRFVTPAPGRRGRQRLRPRS